MYCHEIIGMIQPIAIQSWSTSTVIYMYTGSTHLATSCFDSFLELTLYQKGICCSDGLNRGLEEDEKCKTRASLIT